MPVMQQFRFLVGFYFRRFLINNGKFLLKNGTIMDISDMCGMRRYNILLFLDPNHPALAEAFREALRKEGVDETIRCL